MWRCVLNLRARKARPDVDRIGSERARGERTVAVRSRTRQLPGSPLAALPERQRLVVFLRYFADLEYREIASALEIEVGTVGATLSAAHAALTHGAREGTRMSGIDLLPELGERLEPTRARGGPRSDQDWEDMVRCSVVRIQHEVPGAEAASPPSRADRGGAVPPTSRASPPGRTLALRGGGDESKAAPLSGSSPVIRFHRPRPASAGSSDAAHQELRSGGHVQPDGRLEILWRCPHPGYFCGDMTSMAWSADGRKLAFTEGCGRDRRPRAPVRESASTS